MYGMYIRINTRVYETNGETEGEPRGTTGVCQRITDPFPQNNAVIDILIKRTTQVRHIFYSTFRYIKIYEITHKLLCFVFQMYGRMTPTEPSYVTSTVSPTDTKDETNNTGSTSIWVRPEGHKHSYKLGINNDNQQRRIS